jgi:iron(III) transport system permease protein
LAVKVDFQRPIGACVRSPYPPIPDSMTDYASPLSARPTRPEPEAHAGTLVGAPEPKGRRWRRGTGLAAAAVAIAALLATPVLAVFASVFQESEGTWDHLAATVLPDYIVNTVYLAAIVGVGVFTLGVGTAWLVTMCRFPGRRAFEWLLILPLAFPAYVIAYAYTDFLQHPGPVQTLLREATGWGPRAYWFPEIRSIEGAGLMFTLVLYPYVYLLTRTAFLNQSICVLEVSRTLGRSAWQSFRQVALPLARPAIATGVALALMETLADFGTVYHFGVQTFTTGIYRSWFSMGDRIAAAQLAASLLGLVLLLLLLERWQRGRAQYFQTSRRYQQLPGYTLTGWRKWGAVAACSLPVGLGFALPLALLVELHATGGHAFFGTRYIELVFNSFTLSGVAAALAVALALLMAYAARMRPSALTRGANRMASLGYAVPGSIIAVGILIPLASFDNALDAWMRATFGVSTGLLLTGSIAALIFAYLVRFMAVALNTVDSSLAKITPSMDDAARTLGAGSGRTLRRVHAPLLRGGLLTAALIVFVDVMKELPATLIMRPFDFDTLAIQAHRLAADERLSEAATPSLAIAVVGLLPVILLSREIMKSRPGHAGE